MKRAVAQTILSLWQKGKQENAGDTFFKVSIGKFV
jgi:hypothetical protein